MTSPLQSCALPENLPSSISVIRQLSASKYPVYLVSNSSNDQLMALKLFPVNDTSYIKEKSALESLSHPHIVELLESNGCADVLGGQRNSYLCLNYALYGDLYEIIAKHGRFSEKLARTLFRQLLEALAYMHEQNFAHMDLKIDNLLLTENFELKVTDFDLTQQINSTRLEAKGTPGCRAPEIKKGLCGDLKAADVYSAAIVLFVLISGNPPYNEVERAGELEFDAFYKVMRSKNSRFWEAHAKHRGNSNFYSKEFIELFNKMAEEDPLDRITIKDIKNSEWYQGPVYDKEEYRLEMEKYMKKI